MSVVRARGRWNRSRFNSCGIWLPAAAISLLLYPGTAQPDDTAQVRLLIRDASRALQAGNAPLFLAAFDRQEMPRFDVLREQVSALAAQRRIASSVESGPLEGDPNVRTVRVDWLLELTPKLDPGPLERRRTTLTLRVRKRGKRWKIVWLEPLEFFSALR